MRQQIKLLLWNLEKEDTLICHIGFKYFKVNLDIDLIHFSQY